MKCLEPISLTQGLVPCNRCQPCVIRRRLIWTTRLQLEAEKVQPDERFFVTLTYSEDHLPRVRGVVTLSPKDPRDWIKRCRHDFATFRYFLAGEYGDVGRRPHYHAVVFATPMPGEERGRDYHCGVLAGQWPFGFTHIGACTPNAIAYVCGYVLKKLGSSNLGEGQYPEFIRMSRRPGIGAHIADEVGPALAGRDVPTLINVSGEKRPLGRFLRSKIAESAGVEKEVFKRQNLERLRIASDLHADDCLARGISVREAARERRETLERSRSKPKRRTKL